MQICTSPWTDNHASTPLLSFVQARCPSCCPTNSVKALKAANTDSKQHTFVKTCQAYKYIVSYILTVPNVLPLSLQDQQNVYRFLHHSTQVSFCSTNSWTFWRSNMFSEDLHNPNHVFHYLLPLVCDTSHNYSLRSRVSEQASHLTDYNFITHMLFYQLYWQHFFFRFLHLCPCFSSNSLSATALYNMSCCVTRELKVWIYERELTGVTVRRPSTMLSIVISMELVIRRSSRMTDGGMLGNTSLTCRTCLHTAVRLSLLYQDYLTQMCISNNMGCYAAKHHTARN